MGWLRGNRETIGAAVGVIVVVALAFLSGAGSGHPNIAPPQSSPSVYPIGLDRLGATTRDASGGWQHGLSDRGGPRIPSIQTENNRAPSPSSTVNGISRAVATIPPPVTPFPTPAIASATLELGSTVPPQVRQWQPYIQASASQYRLDPNLLAAIIMTESSGNPNATSSKGAIGLMQVVGGSYDPATNVAQGAKIFADNLRQFGGDVELSLAAYNAGANSVTRFQGIPPFLETENYVFEVLNRYYLYSPG